MILYYDSGSNIQILDRHQRQSQLLSPHVRQSQFLLPSLPSEVLAISSSLKCRSIPTATREQFTVDLTNRPIPVDAGKEWRDRAEVLQKLLHKLAFHEAMQPNLQQTYMTPANSKNKVYFMWDFVGRTLGILYAIPSKVTWSSNNEACADVMGRNGMAADLILDKKKGMLDMMVPGQQDSNPQFDAETLELARKLNYNFQYMRHERSHYDGQI